MSIFDPGLLSRKKEEPPRYFQMGDAIYHWRTGARFLSTKEFGAWSDGKHWVADIGNMFWTKYAICPTYGELMVAGVEFGPNHPYYRRSA